MSSAWYEKSDILYLKTDDSLWALYKVRLVRDDQTLEMRSTKSQDLTTIFLEDGFLVQPVRSTQAERLNEFCIRGKRGTLKLAAASLDARDDWLEKLEALDACRNKLRHTQNGALAAFRRSQSSASSIGVPSPTGSSISPGSRPLSQQENFLDNRASARVDGVFGSYLYKKTRWRQWRKRYFLLLTERGEIRRYNSALPEAWRERMATRGDAPKTDYIYSLKGAKLNMLDHNRFSLTYYEKIENVSTEKQKKAAIQKKYLVLDTRAPDLCRAWVKKVQAAIELAKRRFQEKAELSRAIEESRNVPSPPRRAKTIIATPDLNSNDIQAAIASSQGRQETLPNTTFHNTRRRGSARRPMETNILPSTGSFTTENTSTYATPSPSASNPLPPPLNNSMSPTPDKEAEEEKESPTPTHSDDDTSAHHYPSPLIAHPVSEKQYDPALFSDTIDGPWINISARSNGGRVISCTILQDATVQDLKAMIHHNNPDLPPTRIKFLFQGQPLDDDAQRLHSDLNITDGTELFFVLRF